MKSKIMYWAVILTSQVLSTLLELCQCLSDYTGQCNQITIVQCAIGHIHPTTITNRVI